MGRLPDSFYPQGIGTPFTFIVARALSGAAELTKRQVELR